MEALVWERLDWLRTRFSVPHIRTGLRAAGAFLVCWFILWSTPGKLYFISKHSPLLAFNLLILILWFLYIVWKKYGSDISVTLFRLVMEGMNQAKNFRDEYLQVPSASPSHTADNSTVTRRKKNRKVVRIMMFFMIVQLVLVPDQELSCVNGVLAYKFIRDFFNYFVYGIDTLGERIDYSNKLHYALHIGKGFLAANILFFQFFYVSKAYVVLTFLYFVLLQRYLERPLTLLLELLQLDRFEGMEQYYISTLLCATELTLCLVFSFLILLENHQLLMLVSLYTNVYSSCREFLQDNVTCAFGEWASLAQYEKATKEELREYDDVCAICLSTMKTARKTKCNHFFHGPCLRRCLKEKPTCPMCSTNIKKDL